MQKHRSEFMPGGMHAAMQKKLQMESHLESINFFWSQHKIFQLLWN